MGTAWSSSRGPSTANERVERLKLYSDSKVIEANLKIFEELKADPKFSTFFSVTFSDMKVGRKIAQGLQSNTEIFEGEFTLMQRKFPCALKIFKAGLLEFDLYKQFPDSVLEGGNAVFPGFSSGTSLVLGGLILEDGEYAGSFAIVTRRVWGNLRTLIELRMSKLKFLKRPPFGDTCAKKMMLEIAIVMQHLHGHGILHRFLHSRNVMVRTSTPPSLIPDDIEDDAFHVHVFDFESTVGLIGGYIWRPPEIHQQMQERKMQNRNYDGIEYTTKSDVYSYALICYEILTGRKPFGNLKLSEMDIVYNAGSHRPQLPKLMDKWLRDLIEKCWQSDPSQRPEFQEIVQVFKSKVPDPTPHAVEQEVEASKSHWSEICNSDDQDDLQEETNHQIFENLKQHPEFSKFFSYTFRNLKPGRKIAEGGQAKIFEAVFEKENGVKVPCVVKLFKHISLRDMVQQWPPGMLRSGDSPGHLTFGFMGLFRSATRTCEVLGALVDNNDDFAFILNREGGDLRRLIEHRMRQPSTQSRPFKPEFAKRVMYEIALGMQHLHDRGILHRDLKASNVLVTNVFGEFPSDANDELIDVKVADFECSMLVEGTRFWRAPEILKQIKSRTLRTYTRDSDVYSYGMTCYEVLTGGIPLEHLKGNDYAAVCVRGERPVLPDGTDGWLKCLVKRCWHSEPSERPEFKEIVEEFEKNCPKFQS